MCFSLSSFLLLPLPRFLLQYLIDHPAPRSRVSASIWFSSTSTKKIPAQTCPTRTLPQQSFGATAQADGSIDQIQVTFGVQFYYCVLPPGRGVKWTALPTGETILLFSIFRAIGKKRILVRRLPCSSKKKGQTLHLEQVLPGRLLLQCAGSTPLPGCRVPLRSIDHAIAFCLVEKEPSRRRERFSLSVSWLIWLTRSRQSENYDNLRSPLLSGLETNLQGLEIH